LKIDFGSRRGGKTKITMVWLSSVCAGVALDAGAGAVQGCWRGCGAMLAVLHGWPSLCLRDGRFSTLKVAGGGEARVTCGVVWQLGRGQGALGWRGCS
jgi:hypothetical protein